MRNRGKQEKVTLVNLEFFEVSSISLRENAIRRAKKKQRYGYDIRADSVLDGIPEDREQITIRRDKKKMRTKSLLGVRARPRYIRVPTSSGNTRRLLLDVESML